VWYSIPRSDDLAAKSKPVTAEFVDVVATSSSPAEPGTDIACEPDALPAAMISSFDPSVKAKVSDFRASYVQYIYNGC
jgi:hypothetical protein